MDKVILPHKNSPFRNIKITVDGILFDSKGEAKRYVALRIKQQKGEIQALRIQVPYELDEVVDGVRYYRYIADFVYQQDGQLIIEDYKGILTDVFKIKRKLMKKKHGIKILITRKPTAFSDIGLRRSSKKK